MSARWKAAFGALLACAFFAYLGILNEGRSERSSVVDITVYGGRLAAEGTGAYNSAFDPRSGSAAIGRNYRFHSFASWAILTSPPLANGRQSPPSEPRWLYVMAENPQFFSDDGYERVYVGSTLAGKIKAISAKTSTGFAADPGEQTILMPPARTVGYRFMLPDDRSCSRIACNVTIRGFRSFWHVYRLAIVGETPRFVAVQNR